MRGEPFAVAGALDDDLVAGVGQVIEGAAAENGVLEQAQPLVHGAVAGDEEAGGPVAVQDQLVEVGRLLGGEPVQAQVFRISRSGVRKDRKVRSTELSPLAWAGLYAIQAA